MNNIVIKIAKPINFLALFLVIGIHVSHAKKRSENLDGSLSYIVKLQIENRDISIYLPKIYYYKTSRKFKVVYFNDGQELFQGGWHLDSLLDLMIAKGVIEPIVVVGIHSNRNRNSDLIPYKDNWILRNWGFYQPLANEFSDTIHHSIIPTIEQKFKVKKGAENRAIAGVSLGGLFALWDAIENPNKWAMVIAMSPSFWVDDYEIFTTLLESEGFSASVWFDIGATTGEWNDYVPIIELLREKGLEYGRQVFYFEDPQGKHNSSTWARRIIYPLIAFVGKDYYQPTSMEIEIEKIRSSSSNKIFRRINPIIQLENGLLFSASTQANYQVLNPKNGRVTNDGRYYFDRGKKLEIEVKYHELKQVITVYN